MFPVEMPVTMDGPTLMHTWAALTEWTQWSVKRGPQVGRRVWQRGSGRPWEGNGRTQQYLLCPLWSEVPTHWGTTEGRRVKRKGGEGR